jgi:hypothetical protein
MACPNCHSNNTWEDNLHWGCESCGWCSIGMLNNTRTPSNTPAYTSPQEQERLDEQRAEWAEQRRLRDMDEDNY